MKTNFSLFSDPRPGQHLKTIESVVFRPANLDSPYQGQFVTFHNGMEIPLASYKMFDFIKRFSQTAYDVKFQIEDESRLYLFSKHQLTIRYTVFARQ